MTVSWIFNENSKGSPEKAAAVIGKLMRTPVVRHLDYSERNAVTGFAIAARALWTPIVIAVISKAMAL